MEIEFEFSGGYGGLFARQPLSYRARVDDLPPEVGRRLSELIEAAGLERLEGGTAPPAAGPGRDVFTYRLSIREHGGARSFAFDDVTAPSRLRPLLGYLRELALERRAKDA